MAIDLAHVARKHHGGRPLLGMLSAAVGGMLHASSSSSHAQCAYDVRIVAGRDCGEAGGSPTTGRGINEFGQVVGGYTVCGIGTGEAFVWDGSGALTTLQRPPGIGGAGAWDINDAGLIAGTMAVTGVGDRAFVHDGTRFIDLGVPPGAVLSFGRGINNGGDVVGKWGIGVKAFLYREGVMIDLMPDLGTPSGEALDVNDLGQVVGWMGTASADAHAYIWEAGAVIDLGVIPGGFTAKGNAINSAGQVVGSGRVRINEWPFFASRAFLWNGTDMVYLGTLPGFDLGSASDINDAGQVVGSASTLDSQESGFIWQNGTMTDLNDLIPANAGVHINSARAINNQGQITGQGDTGQSGYQIVAVLLTPAEQPEGDLDGDCEVGVVDFLMLLAQWGPCPAGCPPSCAADFDGDCTVGILDFLVLLANWG